ncbi:MAG: PilZ domain-containing protein [Pseudomonadota bacterium]
MSVTVPKRQSKRVRTLLDARLNSSLGCADVRVRDVSREGAVIEACADAAHEGDVALEFLGHDQPGAIVWRDGSWLGIQFHTALPDWAWAEVSARQLRVSAPRNFRHDQIEDDPERLDIIPRRIELRIGSK